MTNGQACGSTGRVPISISFLLRPDVGFRKGIAPAWSCWVLAALALVAQGPATAQIYTASSGDSGSIVLSNFRSAETPVLLIEDVDRPAVPNADAAASKPEKEARTQVRPKPPVVPADLSRLIASVAGQVDIAPELLHAVITVESRYDSRAVSPKGAIGLMQLMPATAKRFGVSDPYEVRQNVLAGASYLKWLMALFENDLELVLAAYNAGERAVLKAGRRIPPYPETQAYVPRVLAYLRCASSEGTCKPG